MTTTYNLSPIGFDRHGNVQHYDVTNNEDTYGCVTSTDATSVVRFLKGQGQGPATRSCGKSHKAGRAYRTVAHHYTGDGHRKVRPMFWTIAWDGAIREVWSVTNKTMVFGGGTSINRPNWTELRNVELANR